MSVSASTIYVLILISHASDGSVLGTSQARFDTQDACKVAGKAAQELGGTASWEELYIWAGKSDGWHQHGQSYPAFAIHNRIEFQCAAASLIEYNLTGGK